MRWATLRVSQWGFLGVTKSDPLTGEQWLCQSWRQYSSQICNAKIKEHSEQYGACSSCPPLQSICSALEMLSLGSLLSVMVHLQVLHGLQKIAKVFSNFWPWTFVSRLFNPVVSNHLSSLASFEPSRGCGSAPSPPFLPNSENELCVH